MSNGAIAGREVIAGVFIAVATLLYGVTSSAWSAAALLPVLVIAWSLLRDRWKTSDPDPPPPANRVRGRGRVDYDHSPLMGYDQAADVGDDGRITFLDSPVTRRPDEPGHGS